MGKGKAKIMKVVNKKAKKSKSELSSRQRWSGGNEPIRNHHLRGFDFGFNSGEQSAKTKSKKKKKDKSNEPKSGQHFKKDQKKQRDTSMPSVTATLERINNLDRSSPWLETHACAAITEAIGKTEQRPHKRPRSVANLPTFNIPTELLDEELMAFAAYVQLTPDEHSAREALVQSLQEVAAKQQQEVRVFGSFATPQVCVFSSDIDIALWGAISDPPAAAPAPTVKAAPSSVQVEQERKRQRIESWRVALAQVDAANETVPDGVRHASVGSLQEALSTTKSTEEDTSPTFVIDRVGFVPESSDPVVQDTTTAQPQISPSRDTFDESDDDDSADKMESYQRSQAKSTEVQPNYARYVSLSSESSDDESVLDDDDTNVNNMHVSFFNNPLQARAGPTGRIRNKVLDALGSFRQDIRSMNSKWIRKVTFITKARVPILKMDTTLGVEVDVAIGGHNGTDTSQFAAKQSELYKRYAYWRFVSLLGSEIFVQCSYGCFSFSTVVLFLKALLHQHRLDVPYTGGLGSYKLYVLVAYHIQQHLLAGGQDVPGEVLMSFFFRFGDIHGFSHVSQQCRTRLRQHEPLYYQDDTTADLSNVFNLELCRGLFRRSWDLLSKTLTTTKKSNTTKSRVLRHLIDGHQIRAQRELCQLQTAQVAKKLLPRKRQMDDEASVPAMKRLRFS